MMRSVIQHVGRQAGGQRRDDIATAVAIDWVQLFSRMVKSDAMPTLARIWNRAKARITT